MKTIDGFTVNIECSHRLSPISVRKTVRRLKFSIMVVINLSFWGLKWTYLEKLELGRINIASGKFKNDIANLVALNKNTTHANTNWPIHNVFADQWSASLH